MRIKAFACTVFLVLKQLTNYPLATSVGVLLLLLAITYHSAPNNGFQFDDKLNILEQSTIRLDSLSLPGLLSASEEGLLSNRALPNISFAIDWWRGGGKPGAFQWTNISIHALTTLLLFAFILCLLRQHYTNNKYLIWFACAGAALWAVHPIQTQAVTYIVQRMASMAALFSLLCVFAYIKGRLTINKQRWAWFALACFAFALGALSKENAWATPAFILIAEFGAVRHKQPLIQYKLDYLWLALPVVTFIAILSDLFSGIGPLSQYIQKGYAIRDFTLEERLLTQPRVIAFHLSQILWPEFERFSLMHDFTISSGILQPFSTFFALLGLLIWCAAGLWLLFKQNYRLFGFLLLWLPLTLAVESSVMPLEMIFEHRMYLPSVALAALAAFGITAAWQFKQPTAIIATLVAFSFLIFSLTATMQRIPQWNNGLTLFESALDNAPNSKRVLANLAFYKILVGLPHEGLELAAQAWEIKPDDPLTLKVLGLAHMRLGNFALAEQRLKESYELAGASEYNLLSYLGELFLLQQRYAEAHPYFLELVKTQPSNPHANWYAAQSFEYFGECNMAEPYWNTFIILTTDPRRKNMAISHLQRQYQSPTGKCYGAPSQ